MPPTLEPNEDTRDLLRTMCDQLDGEDGPCVALFEPMMAEEDGMWFSTQVIAVPDGEHPGVTVERLAGPAGESFRAGAKAVGIVAYGTAYKFPPGVDPAEAMSYLTQREKLRLPQVRVRTQVIVIGPYAWGRTTQLDQEGAIDMPTVFEDHLEVSPLIEAAQYLLLVAATDHISDPPTGGEG